jgi:hypothetical protein
MIPFSSTAPPTGPPLRGKDGQRIACWGSCSHTLHASGRRFDVNFLRASVAFPILGADFLYKFSLILNIWKKIFSAPKGKFLMRLNTVMAAATSFSVIVPEGPGDQEHSQDANGGEAEGGQG